MGPGWTNTGVGTKAGLTPKVPDKRITATGRVYVLTGYKQFLLLHQKVAYVHY